MAIFRNPVQARQHLHRGANCEQHTLRVPDDVSRLWDSFGLEYGR